MFDTGRAERQSVPQSKSRPVGRLSLTTPATTSPVSRLQSQATHGPLQAQAHRQKGRSLQPKVLLLPVITRQDEDAHNATVADQISTGAQRVVD